MEVENGGVSDWVWKGTGAVVTGGVDVSGWS